ncbi:HNH endonuclease [Candidatus Micrarchaeota archaeon]|nr:HNH endonuclease [Candidatus Micrarchaeota archaeon]
MANKWGIPDWLEKKVRGRDQFCVYCHVKFKERDPDDKASWEHIDNDGPPSEDNIALCCFACNRDKRAKKLSEWFDSSYCKKKHINKRTVANIVKKYIKMRK